MIPPTSLAPSSPRIASTSAWASRQCTTTGLPTRRARPIRWRKTRSCTSRGERSRKKSRPISPTATTRGPPARRSISVRTPASASAASWGCTPTVAHTSGSASASAMAAREVGTSVPIVSMRVTPACRARAIISARSPSNSGTCRCAWVSKSSRLTGASQVRGSRRHSESHAPDELARRRRHVHRPSPLRIGGKAGLTRERPVALAPATLDRRETDDVDDLALEPPDVVHGLLESRRRVDRGVGEKEEDVDRRQRGRGPVSGEQEQEDAVIERLDHVLGRGQHQAVGAPLRDDQRVPYLDEDRDEEPEQEQVADDQAHVRQATAEHEEGEETADEGRGRDTPGLREGQDHPGGPRRSTMARATSSRRSACPQSSTSAAAAVARRWAPTRSSALPRTPLSSTQISRSTRAMEASRAATSRMVRR